MINIDELADGRFILPPPPPKPPKMTVLGIACGDHATAPAFCAVRLDATLLSPGDLLFGENPIFETHYTVLLSELLPIGTAYPAVALRTNILARRLYSHDDRGDYHAVVDASGIGRPVVAAIRDSVVPQCHITGVTISSGDAGDDSLLWRNEAKIGLAYLISRLQAILGGGRLHAIKDAGTGALFASLADYDMTTDRGPDLVRALALACVCDYQPVRYSIPPDSLPSARI